jgi:predicted TIM-barrel fold metal-dependent hydrolase
MMNIQPENINTQLITLISSVKPIFDDLGKVVGESKRLDSKYKAHLNHLSLQFKMSGVKNNEQITAKNIEPIVESICDVLGEIEKIMTEISHDPEESKLFLETGVMDKFKEISQRLSTLLS